MPFTDTKTSALIKRAVKPLTPVHLKDIPQPQTVEDARSNLKRYYGTVGDNLIVRVRHNLGSDNRDIDYNNLDPAITDIELVDDHFHLKINIDHLTNLRTLYKITQFAQSHLPLMYTLNLIMRPAKPFVDDFIGNYRQTVKFTRECWRRSSTGNFWAWLYEADAMALFDNSDVCQKMGLDFYSHLKANDVPIAWRYMDFGHTRYLDWLLLGPLSPVQFDREEEETAA